MNRKKTIVTVTPKVRCAIYTRKSTEEGLDQEFNSLDSQREACLAYIASQKAEGWMTGPVKNGLEELSRVFDAFKTDFAAFDPEIKAKFDATAAASTIDGLKTKFQEFRESLKAGNTVQVEAQAGQAIEALDQVTAKANALDGRVITYYVRQVTQEAHALGGPVGLARGGKLPGFGGGDRIRALLEAGEFVIRKEAVHRYGVGLFTALNAMRLKLPELAFRTGGLVQNLFIPPVPAFAAGGPVAAAEAGQAVNINLSFGGGESFPLQTGRDIADRLVRHLQELQRGR